MNSNSSMEKTNPFVTQCSKDKEDEDDTLSLSDLPLYSDQDIEFWVGDPSLISHDEQDFEFSSEMMITSSRDSSNPIVFCGKIIHASPQKIESKKQQARCIRRGTNVGRKVKVSVLNPATKSRWFLFMIGFGPSRFPAKEMHMGDLRKRRTSGRQRRSNGDSSSEEGDDGRRRSSRGFLRFLRCGSGGNGGGGGGSGSGSEEVDVTPSKHC